MLFRSPLESSGLLTVTAPREIAPGEQDFGVLTDFVMIVTNDPLRPMRRLRVTAIIEE